MRGGREGQEGAGVMSGWAWKDRGCTEKASWHRQNGKNRFFESSQGAVPSLVWLLLPQ